MDHTKLHQAIAGSVVLAGTAVHYYGITITPGMMVGGAFASSIVAYQILKKNVSKKIKYTMENNNMYISRGDKKIYPRLQLKQQTDYGWHLIYHVPFGMNEDDFIEHQRDFEVATNSEIEIFEREGKIHFRVMNQKLPKEVECDWWFQEMMN